jgi:hypothetical protein
MKTKLSAVEKMTLSAIAAFPLAVFQGRHLDRLVQMGLVEIVDEWLEVTAAGRDVLETESSSELSEPLSAPDPPRSSEQGSDGGSSGN